jgi:uracil-DNA glycosylase
VFHALELTWCESTKVVIIGQDPYPRAEAAHGLAFSVPCGVVIPPSLRNIHEELRVDLRLGTPDHGSLVPWAHRGVLLLNTALTMCATREHRHRRLWRPFVESVVRVVTRERDPVFLLWGRDAQRWETLILEHAGTADRVIKSSHPGPLSARRRCGGSPAFLGSKPFSQANDRLGRGRIDWSLER